MVEMARSNRKRPLRILCDDWNWCWSGMSQELYSFEISVLIFVFQIVSPATVIFSGVDVLLSVRILFNIRAWVKFNDNVSQAAKDVRTGQKAQSTLLDNFGRIKDSFRRLEVYTQVEPTPEMMDMMARISVEVLSILGIATMEIKQGRMSE